MTDAVAMGGRDCDGGGMRKDRFFRLRSRRPGESGRPLLGAGNSLEHSIGIMGRCGISIGRVGGMNLGYDMGIAEGDSGDELGEISPVEGESKGEIVVVGDDSVETEVMDDTLSRWGEGRRCRDVLTGTRAGTWRG